MGKGISQSKQANQTKVTNLKKAFEGADVVRENSPWLKKIQGSK